jgi:hypothetical protein
LIAVIPVPAATGIEFASDGVACGLARGLIDHSLSCDQARGFYADGCEDQPNDNDAPRMTNAESKARAKYRHDKPPDAMMPSA